MSIDWLIDSITNKKFHYLIFAFQQQHITGDAEIPAQLDDIRFVNVILHAHTHTNAINQTIKRTKHLRCTWPKTASESTINFSLIKSAIFSREKSSSVDHLWSLFQMSFHSANHRGLPRCHEYALPAMGDCYCDFAKSLRHHHSMNCDDRGRRRGDRSVDHGRHGCYCCGGIPHWTCRCCWSCQSETPSAVSCSDRRSSRFRGDRHHPASPATWRNEKANGWQGNYRQPNGHNAVNHNMTTTIKQSIDANMHQYIQHSINQSINQPNKQSIQCVYEQWSGKSQTMQTESSWKTFNTTFKI